MLGGHGASPLVLIVLAPARRRVAAGGAQARRRARPHERRRASTLDLEQPLQLLVGPHRRLLPGAVVLRHRPVAGAALPLGPLGHREPPRPAVQRPAQDPDAVRHPVHRRDGVRLLPVHAAADLLQHAARWRASRRPPHARRAARAARRATTRRFAAQRAAATRLRRGARARRRTAPRRRRAPTLRAAAARTDALRDEAKRAGRARRCPAPRPRTPTTSSSASCCATCRAGWSGLLIAVILCAAMSSTASELSALGADHARSTSTSALLAPAARRRPPRPAGRRSCSPCSGDCVAVGFATFASLLDNLIQAVNILGSLFYGTMLGLFVVALLRPPRRRHAGVHRRAGRAGRRHRALPRLRASASSGTTSSAARSSSACRWRSSSCVAPRHEVGPRRRRRCRRGHGSSC